ncbi:hypothetical protein [Marinimicrobium sp. ARAG 43.8]|uniref:hypothetical protein n=1 Tax=Marinimicrobium sp. ARAG 43.8 TaxID=3418719 RepID=UPI003CF224D0
MRINRLSKTIATGLCAGLILQTTACGTILYPERKGQTEGRLDPAVVALDAVGLLLFLIPGVIAFAVDFSNGTIYLPGGSAQLSEEQMEQIAREDGQVDEQALEELLQDELEMSVDLQASDVQVRSMQSIEQARAMINSQTAMAAL